MQSARNATLLHRNSEHQGHSAPERNRILRRNEILFSISLVPLFLTSCADNDFKTFRACTDSISAFCIRVQVGFQYSLGSLPIRRLERKIHDVLTSI